MSVEVKLNRTEGEIIAFDVYMKALSKANETRVKEYVV